MSLELVSAPAIEPIDLATARQHLRLDTEGSPASHPDDGLLRDIYIPAARATVEEFTNRRLITQSWRLNLDLLPSEIVLPLAPVQSIASVAYVDADGATQTLADDQYTLDAAATPPWLLQAHDVTYPATLAVANAVRVTFVAGYGTDAADVPAPIRNAILLLLTDSYERRTPAEGGADGAGLPLTVRRLLAPYRIWVPQQ